MLISCDPMARDMAAVANGPDEFSLEAVSVKAPHTIFLEVLCLPSPWPAVLLLRRSDSLTRNEITLSGEPGEMLAAIDTAVVDEGTLGRSSA